MQPEQPSLLLVHGAWHGAWYWEEKTAPWLRQQGLNVVTMNLPGHGHAGHRRMAWYSMRDYVDAIEAKLRSIEGPVIVAGHSMGGYAVQKLLERRPQQLAGAILVAAASQRGVWGVVANLARKQTWDFLVAQASLNLYHLVRKPALARAKFYSAELPESALTDYWSRLNNESFRAFLDMLVFSPIAAQHADPSLPKLVIGGGADTIFPPKIVRAMARSYGVDAKIFEHQPHSLNLDLAWREVAEYMLNWIRENGSQETSIAV